jgi:hypothetical protein
MPENIKTNRKLAKCLVCVYSATYTMSKNETPDEVKRWFVREIQKLWPVATGSLSLRKSPCIRENCPACKAGDGHLSYSFYGRLGKRRFSIYIPEDLTGEIQHAVSNGRNLQELIVEAGERYTRALKNERNRRLADG